MYFGNLMWFEESFNLVSEPMRNPNGTPTNKMVNNTFIFHTFVLMNWFNTLNCRVLDEGWFFTTLFNNSFLWLIMGGEIALQILMITAGKTVLGSALLGTAEMTVGMHITAWCLGAFSLVVNRILLKIPVEKFRFSDKINLESAAPTALDRVKEGLQNRVDDTFKRMNDNHPQEE